MEKKQTNTLIVKCPHCGTEYHLVELACPGELIGDARPNGIIKDPLGKIIYIDWTDEPVTSFTHCCDNCDKEFIVDASISLKVKVQEEAKDFSTLESSLL